MLKLVFLGIAAVPPPVEAPVPVYVPKALTALTSTPELSGIAWSAALGRYLVVSDDTGLDDRGTAHAPFVFSLDTAGTLDERPVPIAGLDALNDAEALCAGPDSAFFLATSHSLNKKGHVSRARRQLLGLVLRERTLHVLGRVDLTALEGGALLTRAGLPAEGRLDVEALAFRDGALFIGLKSPLTKSGAAVIVRLADAVAALAAGRVRAAAVTRWAEVPLCLPVQDRLVCEGIADMVFLPDGSLVLAANAPKGSPPDGGGALWKLAAPGATPELVRHFVGLKPEGVTLSPKGRLVVVFDRDRAQPQWLEMPLP